MEKACNNKTETLEADIFSLHLLFALVYNVYISNLSTVQRRNIVILFIHNITTRKKKPEMSITKHFILFFYYFQNGKTFQTYFSPFLYKK